MGLEKEASGGSALIRMYNIREHYRILEKVGRGTYGTVFKARGLKDGGVYAIKKLENNDAKLQQEGFPITALRGTAGVVQRSRC
jgi:serine/threonine protein kinase